VGLTNFPKVLWSRTREHQETTGPEKFSTGPDRYPEFAKKKPKTGLYLKYRTTNIRKLTV
jgi:hypothetical protein